MDVYIITQVFMNFKCEICGKNFRDNYDLNRHILKKKKCEFKQESNDTSNINIFKQEDLSHINAQKIVEILKKMWNYTFVKIIIGTLVMILIWQIATRAIKGIASNNN